jgi:hypothetical protein
MKSKVFAARWLSELANGLGRLPETDDWAKMTAELVSRANSWEEHLEMNFDQADHWAYRVWKATGVKKAEACGPLALFIETEEAAKQTQVSGE